jgi:threonine/homoserine/homoserine lactone efflux protein
VNEQWHVVAILLAGHFITVATPGPNSTFILQMALHSRRAALIAALGIFPAGVLWASAGLAGMGQLIAAAPMLETFLRIGGGAYLCYIGWRMIARHRKGTVITAATETPSVWSLLGMGFTTNFLNPKAIAWYTSVFAATGAFDLTAPYRIGVILGMPGLGFLWYLFITLVVSSKAVRAALTGSTRWIDMVSGMIMIAFGGKLLAFG